LTNGNGCGCCCKYGYGYGRYCCPGGDIVAAAMRCGCGGREPVFRFFNCAASLLSFTLELAGVPMLSELPVNDESGESPDAGGAWWGAADNADNSAAPGSTARVFSCVEVTSFPCVVVAFRFSFLSAFLFFKSFFLSSSLSWSCLDISASSQGARSVRR
jgi:hypothetical protein